MATLHVSASALPELSAAPRAEAVQMTQSSHPPVAEDAWQPPARCRQAELQDFAQRLAEASPFPFVIHWGAVPAPRGAVPATPAHVLLTGGPDGSWQARLCTDEELAHWLHALGMYIRATQRQRSRQAQSRVRTAQPPAARSSRLLRPPLACSSSMTTPVCAKCSPLHWQIYFRFTPPPLAPPA